MHTSEIPGLAAGSAAARIFCLCIAARSGRGHQPARSGSLPGTTLPGGPIVNSRVSQQSCNVLALWRACWPPPIVLRWAWPRDDERCWGTRMDEKLLREAALDYHRLPLPGKISIAPTKGLTNQHDLSLAYSPGVAYACLAIRDDPRQAAALTARANLVAVISNGTAGVGLGHIRPLAGETGNAGKSWPFNKIARHHRFDIENDGTATS